MQEKITRTACCNGVDWVGNPIYPPYHFFYALHYKSAIATLHLKSKKQGRLKTFQTALFLYVNDIGAV